MNKLKSESPSSIEEHLAKLYGRINYERQLKVTPRHFKLRNMREILRRLENPHLAYPVIHVAGTKGKGSTCTMVGQILTASGRKTGVYTSPHLETIHQRMAIDGSLITDDELVEVLSTLWPVVQAMDDIAAKDGYRPLTFFEITTAAAFYHFAQRGCDAVVLEVGMGGRLDSTNVCQPTTCIITNISLDHTKQLGSTVDKIAFEKAGIIKEGVPVVSGAIDPSAAEVISKVASENNAPVFLLERDFEIQSSEDQLFDFSGRIELPKNKSSDEIRSAENTINPDGDEQARIATRFTELKLGMIGLHQRINAAVCLAAIETLNARGWDIPESAIRTGLKQAFLFGRTEVVNQSPAVVIDMAHNEASIEALVESLENDLPEFNNSSKKILILAMSRDKDFEKMLRPLLECFDEIVLTKYQDNPRGKNPEELLELATAIQTKVRKSGQSSKTTCLISPNPTAAWEKVWSEAEPDHAICVSGSAFLVGELRKTILCAID